MKKWVKVLIILLVVAVAVVFFGAIVFNLLGYVFDFFGTVSGWLATVSRWLAKIFDFFKIGGIFTAHADFEVVTGMTKNLFLGGWHV